MEGKEVTCYSGKDFRMKESFFNIYHLLAGAFVPYWLLSRKEISGGAKLVYSLLAQQANSRGATQLHSQMAAVSLGIYEGQLARHLMELEEAGLVQVSRGNLHPEDVRVYFPLHPWLTVSENDQTGPSSSDIGGASLSPRLFPRELKAEGHKSTGSEQPTLLNISPDVTTQMRRRRSRRRVGKPRSKHSRDTCYRFALYNVEVLGSKTIYDLEGFTDYLLRTGDQDSEIDEWLGRKLDAA
jgi:hypothetical protein